MPVWQKSRRTGAAVALGSGSETESSSESVSSSEFLQPQSGSVTVPSHSGSSYQCELPPKPSRRASIKSVPAFGIGAGSDSNSLVALSLGKILTRGMASGRQFARTQSNPEIVSKSRRNSPARIAPPKGGNSFAMTLPERYNRETMRVLVLGAPQVGKSSLVNSYRAAVTNNMKWPAAPVGICGFCGTTTVDPFPNHPTEPTWLCIDTPGKYYDAEEQPLLERLFSGVPWKTRLAGKGALQPEEVEQLAIVPENGAHQCILVVPATDLVEDNGWSSVFQFKSRYAPAPDAEGVVMCLRNLVFLVRSLMYDASPFVVISKMDLVGGAGNTSTRRVISSLLNHCVPMNRLYFCACPDDQSSYETKSLLRLDRDTRESFLRLHEDLSLTFRWRKCIEGCA
ncbi:GTP-binding protein [Trypanosoma grayi]|uniref:GTP-binding protein n=1 Tax=Trypanosoma grayi TaxID=71804 RepID=UPI0004F46E35|nr:GTP-binding protein [Trypanosoma grayi]KEG14936.1 GTP-binding protein [Trypanosoma grayi]